MPSCITDAISGYGENRKPSKIMYNRTTIAGSHVLQYYTSKIILPVCSVSLHSSTKLAKTKFPVTSV